MWDASAVAWGTKEKEEEKKKKKKALETVQYIHPSLCVCGMDELGYFPLDCTRDSRETRAAYLDNVR